MSGGEQFTPTAFNQPIGDWDTSSVTDMNFMFYLASSFNQPIGNWNVSDVVDMQSMFFLATSFNQDISNWYVTNVSDCGNFSSALTEENTPNFTNCNPN